MAANIFNVFNWGDHHQYTVQFGQRGLQPQFPSAEEPANGAFAPIDSDIQVLAKTSGFVLSFRTSP